jgi:FKBP-type peptidyl-prolyl cis-trans isomerase FklB
MRLLRWLPLGVLLMGVAVQAQTPAAYPAELDKAKLSYAIGYKIGSQFADGKPALDLPTLQRAIQDAYARRDPSVSMQDMHQQLQRLGQQMHAEAMATFKRMAIENAKKSAAYLAQNRKQPGVVQLPSGIQYAVLKRAAARSTPRSPAGWW